MDFFLESGDCKERSVAQIRICEERIILWRITWREEAVAGAKAEGTSFKSP
jgi:hypothetical protein